MKINNFNESNSNFFNVSNPEFYGFIFLIISTVFLFFSLTAYSIFKYKFNSFYFNIENTFFQNILGNFLVFFQYFVLQIYLFL